ncbi:MAG: hypothetical protein RLZZ517_651 [Candidatus Parcubacteria bacterium]|jgi:hypothetical protein
MTRQGHPRGGEDPVRNINNYEISKRITKKYI